MTNDYGNTQLKGYIPMENDDIHHQLNLTFFTTLGELNLHNPLAELMVESGTVGFKR